MLTVKYLKKRLKQSLFRVEAYLYELARSNKYFKARENTVKFATNEA